MINLILFLGQCATILFTDELECLLNAELYTISMETDQRKIEAVRRSERRFKSLPNGHCIK